MRSRKNYADWSYQARTNRVKIVGCPNAENRKRYDFFVRHLLGVTPPLWEEIEK